jgi:small subunit ribosomal protein S8
MPKPMGGLGVAVMSTSAGVVSDRIARKTNVGGEVLMIVW